VKKVSFLAAGAATVLCLIAGCGGSNSATTGGGNVPPPVVPDPVQGIATPSSVSVVTATNAN
jgi:hypothetical protein